MRVREVACALPLLFSVACQGVSTTDVGVSGQELGKKSSDQKAYDKFDGKYDVASFTSTIVRTGGIAGAPIPADFYYPDGCDGDKEHKGRR